MYVEVEQLVDPDRARSISLASKQKVALKSLSGFPTVIWVVECDCEHCINSTECRNVGIDYDVEIYPENAKKEICIISELSTLRQNDLFDTKTSTRYEPLWQSDDRFQSETGSTRQSNVDSKDCEDSQ